MFGPYIFFEYSDNESEPSQSDLFETEPEVEDDFRVLIKLEDRTADSRRLHVLVCYK